MSTIAGKMKRSDSPSFNNWTYFYPVLKVEEEKLCIFFFFLLLVDYLGDGILSKKRVLNVFKFRQDISSSIVSRHESTMTLSRLYKRIILNKINCSSGKKKKVS